MSELTSLVFGFFRYWKLDPNKVYSFGPSAWDTAVHDASEEYKHRMVREFQLGPSDSVFIPNTFEMVKNYKMIKQNQIIKQNQYWRRHELLLKLN